MEEGRSAFKILKGTPAGMIPLGMLKRRWEDIIRKGFKEIAINTRNWVDSAQKMGYWRVLVNVSLNLLVP